MTEDEWVEFVITGRQVVASVGRLEPGLCSRLGASTNLVRLRHDYARKMVDKHQYEPHRLPMMEQALQFGRVISDRRWHLSFFHYDEIVFGGWNQLTIKSAERGSELWVATFHPISVDEVRRLCKRFPIIRPEQYNGQP